jgi:hypothetical protein
MSLVIVAKLGKMYSCNGYLSQHLHTKARVVKITYIDHHLSLNVQVCKIKASLTVHFSPRQSELRSAKRVQCVSAVHIIFQSVNG